MNNNYFSNLANQIRKTLKERTFDSNEVLYKKMVELEEIWRDTLIASEEGEQIYADFIQFIVNVKGNLLSARPYFRLRQKQFLADVNPYIRKNKHKPLMKVPINSSFIAFAAERYAGPYKKELDTLALQITQIRSDFITRNFPLILNRVKILYHHNSHLEIDDLISQASSGALVALDKFVMPTNIETGEIEYTSVILSSIIARITAVVSQSTDSQKLYLYPSDKKRFIEICRLKKDGIETKEIAEKLNLTEFDVIRFLNGINVDNIDSTEKAFKEDNISRLPDVSVEATEEQEVVKKHADKLSLLERKILILKGMLTYE